LVGHLVLVALGLDDGVPEVEEVLFVVVVDQDKDFWYCFIEIDGDG
jgi:hypothetical protein